MQPTGVIQQLRGQEEGEGSQQKVSRFSTQHASGCGVGCANKDLDGYLGPLGKFIEHCRITGLLPIIPLGIRINW